MQTTSASQAWITRFDQPLALADAGSALLGLTFAVKDNIDVAGVPTTAACPDFAFTPIKHATVVRRLLESGAQLRGKTNLDQFACGLSGTRSPYGVVPSTFSALHIGGGSSSGSAHVVATGQVDFALGTDTAGSGRIPAAFNNIVGLKPTRGLVSAAGVVPAARSVDCVSIFATTVDCAVRVLSVAAAPDRTDPWSRALKLRSTPFSQCPRVGIPSALEFFGDELAAQAFARSVQRVRDLGASLVPVDYAPLAEAASLLYDSALVAERYAAIRPFMDAHPESVIEPVRSIIDAGRRYSAADWCDAQTQLRACGQQADAMWADIDVLLVPTAPTQYTVAQMQADPIALNRNLGYYTNFVNLLDYAALSVPACLRADGLPFGVTLIGPAGSDWALAELGQRYHQATGLARGALGKPLPAPQPIVCPAAEPMVRIAVVGAHLSGMPLNEQLLERRARLVCTAETAPDYRLYVLPGTQPARPGLVRGVPESGGRIALEIWEMPETRYGSFVALIPRPLTVGTLTLSDGSEVQGFLCEAHATSQARDITDLGGWRAYVEQARSLA